MGKSGTKQSQDQTYTSTTTQTDNRVGASEQAVVLQGGGTAVGAGGTITNVGAGGSLTIESLDTELIATTLGITADVAEKLARFALDASQAGFDYARDSQAQVFDFGAGVAEGSGALASQALDLASQTTTGALLLSESSTAEISKAFDRFGTDLSAITERTTLAAQTGGVAELNKTLLGLAAIGAAVAGLFFFSRNK